MKTRLVRIVRIVLCVVVIAGALYALARQWDDASAHIDELSLPTLLLALVAAAAGVVASMLSWRSIIVGLGSPLPPRSAFAVFFLAQLTKYIPGGVWGVIGQMELARRYGVARTHAVVGFAATIFVAVVSSAGVAVATIPIPDDLPVSRYAALVVIIPAIVMLHPAVMSRLVAFALRVLRREPVSIALGARAIVSSLLWMLLNWALSGISIWLLARDLAIGEVSLGVATGAFALAWTIGFLVLVVPTGAGVREAAIVVVLAPHLGSARATVLAVTSRLLLTVTDVVLAATAGAMIRRPRERALQTSASDLSSDLG